MMSRIITVSREFGSGGRELGKRLADELGFAYYDREVVAALARRTGMNEEYLEHQLEQGNMMTYSLHYGQTFAQFSPAEPTVQLMSQQCKLIKELADKSDCIFVGRAADVVLEEFKPFKLFVYADDASKLVRCRARAPEGENLSDKELIRQMKRIDKARAEYHDIISTYAWGDRNGYHLCVNTTGVEIKTVVPAIADYFRCLYK